jgi:hypothetical protein
VVIANLMTVELYRCQNISVVLLKHKKCSEINRGEVDDSGDNTPMREK